MSRATIDIFKVDYISEEDFIKCIQELGVEKLSLRRRLTGIIQVDEAAIWVYYENNKKEFSEFLEDLDKLYNLNPSVSIWLELSSDKEAGEIALDFCRKLSEKYPDIIICDELGEYYWPADLYKLEVKENWKWGFKDF